MDVAALPYKIGQLVEGEWIEFRHSNRFFQDSSEDELSLKIGASRPFELFLLLIKSVAEPASLLVVYHSPRIESEAARYQYSSLSIRELETFLHKYRAAFDRDSRADLWLVSEDGTVRIGWEKHDLIYVFGLLDQVQESLIELGFECGDSDLPFPHTHHYHEEFDFDFQAMLCEFDWQKSPLEPGDGD